MRCAATPKKCDRDPQSGMFCSTSYFDGVFQSLPLPPGGHTIVLYLEGYRTVRHNLYLVRGSTFSLRETLSRLPAGEKSEPPLIAPAVPAPPAGTYRMPVTPAPSAAAQDAARKAVGFGTLDVFVQPDSAEVMIDGEKWVSTEKDHFIMQLPPGTHRVEVSKPGYHRFSAEIVVREGETTPLNVSLTTTAP